MASLKQLASQTAIYGVSSILGRLLNFLLTPLHTGVLNKEDYGVNIDIYSYIAVLMVLLTFGMETAFFKFFNDKKENSKQVFSAAVSWVGSLCLLFSLAVWVFLEPLAQVLRYAGQAHFIFWAVLIVSADALAAVPFAKLRAENKPMRFLFIRLSTIIIFILLNLFFFALCPYWQAQNIGSTWLPYIYQPQLGVAYIFIANLIGNGIMLLLFWPEFIKVRFTWSKALLQKMVRYAAPLVVAGLAGVANEMANRQFLKFLSPPEEAYEAVGTFGAMMKIATFMVLFIQAFRFAAEPFFFSGQEEFRTKMAQVMRYFVVVQSVVFLALVCFTPFLQWTEFIDPKYYNAWHLVPILVFANLLLGINFNLNIWYKLEGKTYYGAYIAFFGLGITVISNLILVPRYGLLGSAWATLITYACLTGYGFYLNQKHYHIQYPLKAIGLHLTVAVGLAYLSFYVLNAQWLWGLGLFSLYLAYLALVEGKTLLNAIKK
jgi:O-antigen/teichoic acid export membrane protein